MNKIITCLGAAALTLTAAAGVATAKDGARMEKFFEKVDVNGDGAITQSESQTFRDARFQRMDSDGDGVVTLQEMTEAGRKRGGDWAAKRFERMDANGDGVIRRTEFEDMAARRFEAMDANGDGAITMEEVREGFARRKGG
jgi:Ca2+-binding EF-hand superfamily protein